MTNGVTIMGRVAMIMMVALLLGACGSSGNNLEKLHGSWNLDQQKTVDLSKEYGKMSKEMKAELLGRMGQPSMQIDVFSKKIALIKGPQDQGLVLPFEVKKDSGDTLIILINQSETKIVFDGSKKMTINTHFFKNVTGFSELAFVKSN